MHSEKRVKRAKKFRNLKNHNNRKWQSLIKKRQNIAYYSQQNQSNSKLINYLTTKTNKSIKTTTKSESNELIKSVVTKSNESKNYHQNKASKTPNNNNNNQTKTTKKQNNKKKQAQFDDQLIVDVNQTTLQDTPPLTKCSLDSGVDMISGSGNGHDDCHRSETNSTSNEESITEEADEENNKSMLTKFAQNAAQLVEQVKEKLITKTETTNESHTTNFERTQSTRSSQKRKRNPRVHKLLQKDIDYCSYLIENYGDNYEAMVKDPINIYMDDARNISRKIRIYRDYLKTL